MGRWEISPPPLLSVICPEKLQQCCHVSPTFFSSFSYVWSLAFVCMQSSRNSLYPVWKSAHSAGNVESDIWDSSPWDFPLKTPARPSPCRSVRGQVHSRDFSVVVMAIEFGTSPVLEKRNNASQVHIFFCPWEMLQNPHQCPNKILQGKNTHSRKSSSKYQKKV